MSHIQLKGVRKVFGRHQVIRGIDLEIEAGELCVLLGPSGCGKSTLLRLIAGLEEVSAGSIRIGDLDVTGLPPKGRNVAMVFQSYALYPHMTAFENMAFGLRLSGVNRGERENRVRDVARALHIDQMLDRRPAQLSGGQRQRVAIGRAIVREPKVFLFDEPLSNLDAELRARMRLELARLHQRLGTTMVYVTHDQVEAMTLAQRMVVMEGGRLVQAGTPLELYERPVNRFVSGFIGSPRMNEMEGHLVEIMPGKVTVALAGGILLQVAADAGRANVGESVTLGIRPEHLSLDSQDVAIPATAVVVEHLGDHQLVYVEWHEDQDPLTVRVPPGHAPAIGARVRVGLDTSSCHLFDSAGDAFPRQT
jgi:multiple sugar transport system ATP-binding protein